MAYPTNEDIADLLERIADLLEAQDANRFRVGAYRRAARIISAMNTSAAEMAVSGQGERLEDLPDIGKSSEASRGRPVEDDFISPI